MTKKIDLITYFPYFGWMIPLALKKDDTFIIQHVKQGFVLAFFFAALQILLIFSMVFVPNNYRKLKLGIVVCIYVLYGIYFLLCIVGTFKIKNKKGIEFPIVKKFSNKIEL